MSKPTYYELLKHPLWQRKRLEILQRDNFECQSCASTEKTLHVHHTYYEKGKRPWEYPDESLRTLCEDCHKETTDVTAELQRQIGKLATIYLPVVLGYARGMEAFDDLNVVLDVRSHEDAVGIGAVFGLEAEEVIAALQESSIDGKKLDHLAREKRRR